MKRRGLACFAVAQVLLGGCEADPQPTTSGTPQLDPPAPAPGSVAVASEPVPTPAMLGVLVPEAEVVLVASGFARLERLELAVGDHVREGEVVAELDVRGDRGELLAASAAWRASTAELERLELELEQARATREDLEQLEDFVAKAELRERRFAEQLAAVRRRSAGATLAQQRSKVDEAEAAIDDAKLRAPFDGVVARRHVDPGATLTAGEPVVALMSDARLVRFAVPEAQLPALVLGARVRVVFERTPSPREGPGSGRGRGPDTASPREGPGSGRGRGPDTAIELHARVSSIAPQIEAGTRVVIVEAAIAASPQLTRLRVGAIARVRFD